MSSPQPAPIVPRRPAIADAIPPTSPRTPAGAVLAGLLTGLLALGAFNSEGLVSWSRDLEPGPVNDRILEVAEEWHAVAEVTGIAFFRTWVRRTMHGAQGTGEDAGFSE